MPIYEFKCSKCGRFFETLCFSQEDEKEVKCPHCGSKEVKKELSSFTTSWSRSFGFRGSSCGGSSFGFG
ncbi:MAG: zinc ribbon domain-containing protein [Caldimicrobium sp.]|nr:zinc ribbon domain-containing protein [Caldimicrobium sp.]MCX7613167.1 zinc ribbon domain-containing protein [Caldimicrobium sp.]MDW8182531.1 zinc ribbon domain-containing protein [Caldimicrobium sp.]